MKKHLLTCLLLVSFSICCTYAQRIHKVEPLSWWTGMRCPLTLMFYGENLADAQVTVYSMRNGAVLKQPCTGLVPTGQHNAENPNYLFVDMDVREEGTYRIVLKKGRRSAQWDYSIASRSTESRESFSSKDVIYLLMPDRFRDGNPNNNNMPGMAERCTKPVTEQSPVSDLTDIHGRFGGDIEGIMGALKHIRDLGATTVWPTPLTCSNDSVFSYHGYACADYYHIDPRFGTNELYRQMVDSAHALGLKVIMDVVTNHSGITHWWSRDLPYHDWWHQYEQYTTSINVFSTNYDINASLYDRTLHEQGWFDHHMPDMNLDNPDLLHYFMQCYIWWVEYAHLDGFRVDTYPYNERLPMSRWCQAIRDEYPWINIVGECWTRPTSAVAYWQSGAHNPDGFDSHLPAVMDFPLEEAIRQSLGEGRDMTRIYDVMAMDYLYADVNNLLLFLGNHDVDRIADVLHGDYRRLRLAYVMLATMRGIPQIFSGDEYAMQSLDVQYGHSTLRRPLPYEQELSMQQRDFYAFVRQLMNWRQSQPVLHTGRTMHFYSRDNTYAYIRYFATDTPQQTSSSSSSTSASASSSSSSAVLVFINASEETREVPLVNYAEILRMYSPIGTEILTGSTISLRQKHLSVEPLSARVIQLTR